MTVLLSARFRVPLRLLLTAFLAGIIVTCLSAFTSAPAAFASPSDYPLGRVVNTTHAATSHKLSAHERHVLHEEHLAHLRAIAARKRAASAVIEVTAAAQPSSANVPLDASTSTGTGILSEAQIGALWLEAGGPASAEGQAEQIAECESGGNPDAYNPSGATGLMQILGAVVPGNLDDPLVNMENAVAKFRDSGDTFAQWVCQ